MEVGPLCLFRNWHQPTHGSRGERGEAAQRIEYARRLQDAHILVEGPDNGCKHACETL